MLEDEFTKQRHEQENFYGANLWGEKGKAGESRPAACSDGAGSASREPSITSGKTSTTSN